MQRRVLTHLGIWAAWSVPAAFTIAISTTGRALSTPVLLIELLPWYYWAFLTMPIMRHAQAVPVEALRRFRGVARHVILSFTIGSGCGIITALGSIAIADTGGLPPGQLVAQAILFWCLFGSIFYTLITAVGYVNAGQRRLREREIAASRLQARLVEAQLSGLRMQLQPHFLFNTLNTVAMYVRDGDAATSIRVLTRLSELLRRVLDTSSAQEVPLGMELEHVQRYLEIEALRFADRLRVEVDVSPALYGALVPNLALQPLVENAIRHGIARRSTSGAVHVSAERVADQLIVRVYNDGPPLPEGWSSEDAVGIGLRNTRMRIQHLYHERSGLTLRNAGGGVLSELVLPYHV